MGGAVDRPDAAKDLHRASFAREYRAVTNARGPPDRKAREAPGPQRGKRHGARRVISNKPELRAKIEVAEKAKQSATIKAAWARPEVRARVMAGLRAYHARRRAAEALLKGFAKALTGLLLTTRSRWAPIERAIRMAPPYSPSRHRDSSAAYRRSRSRTGRRYSASRSFIRLT